MLLCPLFKGDTSLNIMQSIIKFLGTPPLQYMQDICGEFDFSLFPNVEPMIDKVIYTIKYYYIDDFKL